MLLYIAMALAVVGAAWDVRARRIPNWLVVLLAMSAGAATVASGGWSVFAWAAIHALIALLVGMGLFAMKAIGAGDAKFYSAVAFGVPLSQALPMLGWVSLSALVLIFGMIIWYRGLKIVRAGQRTSWTLPYGLPIACGFVAVALSQAKQPIF